MVFFKRAPALLFALLLFFQQGFSRESLLPVLNDELNREFEILSKLDHPVYYMEYRVNEMNEYVIGASLGSLIRSRNNRQRIAFSNVRIGDYNFDNTHLFASHPSGMMADEGQGGIIPLDNNEMAIKQQLWKITNSSYEKAIQRYLTIRENMPDQSDGKSIPDFAKAVPETFYEPPLTDDKFPDVAVWEGKLKRYTELFNQDSGIFFAEGYLAYSTERKYFVSTEGSSVVQNNSHCQLHFICAVLTKEGNPIPFQKSFTAFTPDRLPSEQEITSSLIELRILMTKLKDAPLAEAYSGPAILSPEAAGVFFHEIFGHRVEGHRMRNFTDSHTFKGKQEHQYLPEYISISFDPQAENYLDTDLFGSYKYDDQGIRGQKVDVIRNGVVKDFLLSRVPVKEGDTSNGHGRAGAGQAPVSRQSNMFVRTKKPLSDRALRKKLIRTCKRQDKEFGYYFKTVIGGFTQTSRYSPNVFNITPIEVYRIYVDGRSDELVRGVNLIGTPLVMFSGIEGTGDTMGVFNGMCGAESGQVPVSTISPALLVNKVETQRQPVAVMTMPVLPNPRATGNSE